MLLIETFCQTVISHRFFIRVLIISSVVLCMAMPVYSETKLKLEETEITGARELPKVLYIVPWKKARPGGQPLPMRSLIDEAMSPIDVDVFKRQVRYYDMTQSPAEIPAEITK